jgi:Fibronectin type III-like domain/Glycosyl hydrolase family 3 C-terminal domain
MPWASQVKSILEMWYPGQQGGPATADVLLGNANPGGHLPVSFPADATHFPTYDPSCTNTAVTGNCNLYPGVAQPSFTDPAVPHGYRQITALDATAGNGIFQGYRWYDKHGVAPLFAFGSGLSYTTFKYANLALSPRDDGSVDVAFDVQNTGSRAGSDVAQVYVGPGPAIAGVQQALRSLRGFDRVQLAPGETKHEVINLAPRSFQYWSVAQNQWVTNPGARTIYVGDGDSASALALGATTPQPVTVGGTVPATLALSIGAPASFGTFTPGVANTYTASTAATVTSTAGDATLSVVDPDTAHPGHLVNGSFFLAQPLQAKATKSDAQGTAYNAVSGSPLNLVSWSAPVSSDPVTLWFQQSIGSNEGLRTGSYGKTLTFTLSTTNP